MLRAKAYTHWYTGEGMGMDEFHEAAENVRDLIAEYQQYEYATIEDDHIDDEDLPDMESEIMDDQDAKQINSLSSIITNSTMATSER